ncbi:hypothetical protein J6590_030574 [Homalodisca vitripennis]|nr:hypothetical protein J6590_030574 [Homalodisca vitripennis]
MMTMTCVVSHGTGREVRAMLVNSDLTVEALGPMRELPPRAVNQLTRDLPSVMLKIPRRACIVLLSLPNIPEGRRGRPNDARPGQLTHSPRPEINIASVQRRLSLQSVVCMLLAAVY